VVLIDEIDKCDMSLPNELLELFEEGEFPIPELEREVRERKNEGQALEPAKPSMVATADPGGEALVREGRVICREFPLILLTSNGEREFPAAFINAYSQRFLADYQAGRVDLPRDLRTDRVPVAL
jgi:hypothetical protein